MNLNGLLTRIEMSSQSQELHVCISLVTQDDKLYIEELSCIKCTVNSVCDECQRSSGALIDVAETEIYDDDDDGQSDDVDSEASDDKVDDVEYECW